MKKVLFIHGFASSGQSSKADDLRQMLNCEVIAPDLQHQPQQDIAKLTQILRTEPIEMIVGSSLGGFYALLLATRLPHKVVLINPSLSPPLTLQDQLGMVESFKGGAFDWNIQHLAELATLSNEIRAEHLQQTAVLSKSLVLLAQQDERLDYQAALVHLDGATFIIDTEQDHRFSDLKKHAMAIQQLYST